MSTRNKLLLFAALLLAFVIFFPTSSLTSFLSPRTPTPTAVPVSADLSLSINYGNLPTVTYSQPYTGSPSAFTLLQNVADQEKIEFTYKKYSFGNLVENIGGYKNTPEKAWVFYVNDQSSSVGASDYLLKPGDKIEWKYVKPE